MMLKSCACGAGSRGSGGGNLSPYENDTDKRRSKEIDKKIKEQAKIYQSTIKLLLLGAGESGKSTVIKQMRIIHMKQFTDQERRDKIADIRSNIKVSILSILNAMEKYAYEFKDLKLKELQNHLLDMEVKNFDFTTNTWDAIDALWSDENVKQCALKGDDYHLLDSAQYFLDRVNIIRKEDYLPNDQDILRCRVLTSGILETKFEHKKVHFHVFDVGGQREERKKWIQCFNDVTAIIFVVDISAYNMTLKEDEKVNRLRESLQLFRSTWVNRWLNHVSVILFLNKYDLLAEKIQSGSCKLETYFPEFKDYKLPKNLKKKFIIENEHPDVTRAKMFILEKFMDITYENISKTINEIKKTSLEETPLQQEDQQLGATLNHKISISTQRSSIDLTNNARLLLNRDVIYSVSTESTYSSSIKKFCIPYFTVGVDTENIKRVFKACNSILQKEHLEKSGLI
jgi:GTPase SAR1 family protein